MNASENVVANVRGLMGETGVTQAQMGHWLGLSQAAVAKRISTRAVVFNIAELDIIAEKFGVSVQSLFDPPRAPFPGRLVTAGTNRTHTHQYCHLRRVTVPRPHLTKAHFALAA